MKKMLEYPIFNRICRALFILIPVTIPFWMLLNNISIVLVTLLSIVNLFFHKRDRRVWPRLFSCFIGIYVLMLLSLLYTDNLDVGFKRLEHRLAFVLFPFIIYSMSNLIDKNLIYKALKFFVYSVFLASLVFLFNAFYNTFYYASLNPFNEVNGNFFSYMKFTHVIEETHPIYFGTYVLFSIFILVNDYFNDDKIFKISNFQRLLFVVFLILISFLLNSFLITGVLLLFIVYFFYNIFKEETINKSYKAIFLIIFLVISSLSSFFVLNKFNGIDIKNDILSRDYSGKRFTALNARIAKWDASIDLILDNFWFGVGVGDERDVLLEYYAKNNFKHGIERRFNSHNQYLTEHISIGFCGLLILFFIFFQIFGISLIDKNYYLLSIGIIYFCFFLTESALVRNKGIVFFVFFVSILPFINKNTLEQ